MKFLIKGSMVERDRWGPEIEQAFADEGAYREQFTAACRQIGERLAADHELLIGSYRENTVGPHVSRGVNAYGEKLARKRVLTVTSYQPKEENEQEPEGLENVVFDPVTNDGPWSVALLPALDAADVVIALGGGENTRALGVSAAALGKPIVAVPSFGGAAKEIWDQNVDAYQTYYGVAAQEARALERPWSEETLAAVLSVADKLVRRGRSVGARLALLGVIAFLLLIWTALFIVMGRSLYLAMVLVLLAISALIGTALRITTRLYTGRVLEVTRQDVLIDTAAGLLLAFVFFLLYVVGTLAYPGNLLEEIQEAGWKIPLETAVVITLVGIAGAFLLDEGIARLTSFLRPFLDGARPEG